MFNETSPTGKLGAKSSRNIFLATIPSVSRFSISRSLSVAVAVVGVVIGGEYFFRHYVLFWLPTFGTLLVNDMLALFLVYLLLTVGLGSFMHVKWRQEVAGIRQALREGLTSWNFTFWVLALVLSVWALSMVDRRLWGNIKVPLLVSYCNDCLVGQFSAHFDGGVAHSGEWSFRAGRRGISMARSGSGPPDSHLFDAFRHWPDGGSFSRLNMR